MNSAQMNQIKVSVVIPVYNSEKYLCQCLESVINQTLKEIEIICVDDGSNDNSSDILKSFSLRDNRIRIISQKKSNAGAARNTGMKQAVGKYLSFLDSDDYFETDLLEKCFVQLEKEESDIVVYSSKLYNARKNSIEDMPWSLRINYCPSEKPFSADDMTLYIFNAFQNWTWNKMFRSDYIKRYSIVFQEIERTNDMAFTCCALALAKKISIIPESMMYYRVNSGKSLQDTNIASPLSFWEAYKNTRDRLIGYKVYEKFKQSYLNWLIEGLAHNLNSLKQANYSIYRKVSGIIAAEADKEFGFFQHETSYYYNAALYLKFKRFVQHRFLSCIIDIVCLPTKRIKRICGNILRKIIK